MPQRHSSQAGICPPGPRVVRSVQVTGHDRMASRVFTAEPWPMATSELTHTCDVTALSGPFLVYQSGDNDDPRMTTKETIDKRQQKEESTLLGHCKFAIQTGIIIPACN